MKTEKQEKEMQVFKFLDKECRQYSTPMPHIMFKLPIKSGIFGFMMIVINEAFQKMRDSQGKSNWECDAKATIGSQISEKRVMTLNSLRKHLLECQGADLIEYSKEVGDEITVKINVMMLFEDIINGEMAK